MCGGIDVKKKIYMGVKVITFVILLCFVLAKCNEMLAIKEQRSRISSFYEEEKDSLEAVFVGSSHMFVSIFPFQLWEEYGIKSASLGGNSIGVPMEYYCVKEAIREQHPDIIVVDLYKAYLDEKLVLDDDIISYTHNMADSLPNGTNKLCMLLDLIPNELRTEFAFPLYLYHSRWKELTREDFEKQPCYTKGSVPLFGNYDASLFTEIPEKEKQEVPKIVLNYIDKMIKECKENDVRLIFTVLPYETTSETHFHQRIFNKLADELADRNAEYYNLFHMMNKVGLNVKTDFFNDNHVNYEGGEKITSYFGKVLSDKGLGKKHKVDSNWEKGAEVWHAYIKSRKITTINNKKEYLDFIDNENLEFIIMIKDFGAFVEYFGSEFPENIQMFNGSGIYIYDDNIGTAFSVYGEKAEIEFNGKYIQIIKEGNGGIILDKESYDFAEDVKIFVYDERLNQMIDKIGLNYKEDRVIR